MHEHIQFIDVENMFSGDILRNKFKMWKVKTNIQTVVLRLKLLKSIAFVLLIICILILHRNKYPKSIKENFFNKLKKY